jgi:hypothetical protein
MSARPASAYLADFSRRDGVNPSARAMPPQSLAERLEAARREGYEQGKAETIAICDARIAEIGSLVQAELAEARKAWAADEGARLAQQMQAGLDALGAGICEATARAIGPVLGGEVVRRSLVELATTVEALLAREPEIGITIAGPKDLLSILAARLSERPSITYRASDQCEVEVRAGTTQLRTRLQHWARLLEEARS